jgi:hypothetical protein
MDLSVETITAKQAEKYLQFNTNNRPLRKSLVSQYAKDMSSGNWRLTHQGVAFNCDGTLLDGQHRLAAIVQSGVTVQMLVARGVDSRNQLVMDDHAKRSAGDALSLARKEKITQSHVAVMRAAVELSGAGNRSLQRLTKQQLDEVVDAFRPAMEFVEAKMPNNERGITSAPVKAAIVLAWYYVKDVERLAAFCDVLTGKSLPDGDGDRAAVVLREWLLRTGMQAETARREGFKKAQRAIVAFQDRKDIGKLYGTTTYYPWPLVDPVRG